jgi:DNA-binding NarL/FixJ family response regulator
LHSPCRVLIADDVAELRLLLRLALELDGRFEVVAEASEGSEVLTLVEAHRPDAVLLDLGMPGTSGLEVVGELKRWRPELRILIFSGSEEREIVNEALARGADAFAVKGSSIEDAISKLAGLCGLIAG